MNISLTTQNSLSSGYIHKSVTVIVAGLHPNNVFEWNWYLCSSDIQLSIETHYFDNVLGGEIWL